MPPIELCFLLHGGSDFLLLLLHDNAPTLLGPLMSVFIVLARVTQSGIVLVEQRLPVAVGQLHDQVMPHQLVLGVPARGDQLGTLFIDLAAAADFELAL